MVSTTNDSTVTGELQSTPRPLVLEISLPEGASTQVAQRYANFLKVCSSFFDFKEQG